MMSEDRRTTSGFQYESTAPNEKLTFTAIPDVIGNFQISAILNPIQFDIGKYTVVAIHPLSKISENIEFEIVTAQSEILSSDEAQEPLTFEICSSTRNDISEIVKDLKQIGKGEIPPSMESIDCDGTTDFVTGEKLVIRGKVVLNDPKSLADSETNSNQMQSGHSYTTNYVTAQNNYVELSIPYPQTLIVSSSYQTVPDSDEDYHGGGGSGGGGVTSGDGTSGVGTGTGDGGSNEQTNHFRSKYRI